MTIPKRRIGQSLAAHQQEVAVWVGCDVNRLNDTHDSLHAALTRWLDVSSHSLASASGKPHDARLAGIEETAVMHVQRLMIAHGVGVPSV